VTEVDLRERLLCAALRIRMVEERVIALYPTNRIQSPVHLCIGHEALAAGACHALRPADLHASRSLQRTINKKLYDVRFDTAFDQVIRQCATIRRPGQKGTWITQDMIKAYIQLHEMGYAHSAEAWSDGELVGGLYGVSLGAAFFGESMFARQPDASKVALVHLVRQLQAWEFHLFDCQVHTEHVARLGATPWPRTRFLKVLEKALEEPTRQGSWRQG